MLTHTYLIQTDICSVRQANGPGTAQHLNLFGHTICEDHYGSFVGLNDVNLPLSYAEGREIGPTTILEGQVFRVTVEKITDTPEADEFKAKLIASQTPVTGP